MKLSGARIDVNDPHFATNASRKLSDIASQQRQAEISEPKVKNNRHSDLLDSDRQSQYTNRFFSGATSRGAIGSQSNIAPRGSAQQPGFLKGWEEKVIDAYKTPARWSAASIEKLNRVTEDLSKQYKVAGLEHAAYAKQILKIPVQDAAAKNIEISIAKTENAIAREFKSVASGLSKFSVVAKRGVVGVDAANKLVDVMRAPEGQRARVGFIKGAEFVGEGIGLFLGNVVADLAIPATGGASFFAAPAISVGTAATGGYLLGYAAEKIEDGIDIGYGYLDRVFRR